eukprot:6185163-Pleurochrysis_carterae.AAC.2
MRPARGLPRRGQHSGLPVASVRQGLLEPEPASHYAVGARQAPAVSPFAFTLYAVASDYNLQGKLLPEFSRVGSKSISIVTYSSEKLSTGNADRYVPLFNDTFQKFTFKCVDMDISKYGIGSTPVLSEMIVNGLVTIKPEQAVITVSSQLNNEVYRLNCDHEWEPHTMVCILPIRGVLIHGVRNYASRDRRQADGSSTRDARLVGYGRTSASLSLSPPILSLNELPSLDYSGGLCCTSPLKAFIVYGYGVVHGEGGMDISECWRSLTFAFNGVRPRSIALGEGEIKRNIPIIPSIRPVLADGSTHSIAYCAGNACQGPIVVLSAFYGSIHFSRGRYPRI